MRFMAATHRPCPSCDRHVRVADARCPFCGAVVPAAVAPRSDAARPLSRAAVLFVGAAAAAACGGSTAPEPGPGGGDAQADAPADAPAATDGSSPEDGSIIVLYGPAPVDAGRDATFDAQPVPIYGSGVVDSGRKG